jgi:hypothetical protein
MDGLLYLFAILLIFLFTVLVTRWLFRINEIVDELKKLNAICRTLNSKFDRKPGLPEPEVKPEIKKNVKGPGLVDRLLKNIETRLK